MDKNNFSEIYKKYVMTAYSAAMQVVHNEADADDIAQETMVKLYLNIDALDEDRVEGWVRVAAKNLGIDYQRKAQRFDWNELDEDLRAEEMELPTLAEEEKQEMTQEKTKQKEQSESIINEGESDEDRKEL